MDVAFFQAISLDRSQGVSLSRSVCERSPWYGRKKGEREGVEMQNGRVGMIEKV
jgi:hypothetical protein